MAPTTIALDASFSDAAAAFRRFFLELREAFVEREALFTQLEMALMCREHVLVIGPPGTAKSAVAGAVLGRITDAATHKPSLFSKQLAENTVQTDLIGPVDFKVLTETGRTEYLTDEGMLGSTHAFLDEVFDGRDMLLRSILNVLHERELKHGRQITKGKCECAVMTSNRYLSEVLARSPETLQAFADRISFICFTPKSFAKKSSRAQMLWRAQTGQRPVLQERLTLQHLDVLQAAVEQVQVPPIVSEGLEALADTLEKELTQQVSRLPDYVPTKYFSQRSVVKALWALKAAVVRDRVYRRSDRALVAELGDLDMLRHFWLLGGPPPADLDALLKQAADPRERAQLEIIRVEHKAFDESLRRILPSLNQAAQDEARELTSRDDLAAAEALLVSWTPVVAQALSSSLRARLVPGPRHPENRAPLLRVADLVVTALEHKLNAGARAEPEGKGGVALVASLLEAFELARRVPELEPRRARLATAAIDWGRGALELAALSAESAEFDDALKLEGLAHVASSLTAEIGRLMELVQSVALVDPRASELLARLGEPVRERIAKALRRRAERVFGKTSTVAKGEGLEQLAEGGRRLRELEDALAVLSPSQRGLRRELLGPLGLAWAREVVGSTRFTRLSELSRALQRMVDSLHREGASPEAALDGVRDQLLLRIADYAKTVPAPPRSELPAGPKLASGQAYLDYQALANGAFDGDLLALRHIAELLERARPGQAVPAPMKAAVATTELASLNHRVAYLRHWLDGLLESLPKPEAVAGPVEADQAFDALVRSRFPLLVTREGELLKLDGAVSRLAEENGPHAQAASAVAKTLQSVAADFQLYARQVLDARARA